MSHPTIGEILSQLDGDTADAELVAHLASCAMCRQLAGLGEPFAERALVELATVDPALYGRREPLREGHAGMGRAFRAWDRRLGREVVIKQIRVTDDPAIRAALAARFEQEARVTARLQHPGIVGVHELGRWPDGEPFYTMPLVGGDPLDEAIAAAPTLAGRLALLPRLITAAETIAYAHDRGIVHRDIKPANILIGGFGETLVIDWGLAKAVGEASPPPEQPAAPFRDQLGDGLTRMGVGTPQYMPPEQARGDEPGPRVDVYALGATLYHLLAGAAPYGGGASDVIRRALFAGAPRPVVEVAGDAPPALIAICDKAMARDPAARFASALELAEELRRFQTGQLTRTHQYSPGEIVRHWLRRHRAAVRVGVVALLVVAALAVLAVRRVLVERDRAEEQRRRAQIGEREARAALAIARGAQASVVAATPSRRLEAIEMAFAAALPAGTEPAPEVVQGLVDALTAGPALVPLDAEQVTRNVVYAPSGARFATIEATGRITAWDAITGARHADLDAAIAQPYWATFSPDGARLAITGLTSRVEVWNPTTGDHHVLDTGGDDTGPSFAAFRSDGVLVTSSATGSIRLWDPGHDTPRAELDAGCAVAWTIAADELAVVSCVDGPLVAWSQGATAPVRLVGHRAETQLEAGPDQHRFYSAGADGQVLEWRTADVRAALAGGAAPAPRRIYERPGARLRVRTSPDGRFVGVLWGSMDLVDLGDLSVRLETGLDVQRTAVPAGAPRMFGGFYAEAQIVGLDIATRETTVRLRGHRPFNELQAAGSSDGVRVVSVTSAGEAWLWDARLGLGAGGLPEHDAEVIGLAIVDGGRIAITASLDGSVRASELADGRIVGFARTGAEITVAATAADDLVTGGSDGVVRLWDASGAGQRLEHGAAPISALAIDATARRLAAGDLDGAVALWDLSAGDRAPLRLALDRDPVAALAIAPDGSWLASGHRSGVVQLWDSGTGARRAAFDGDGSVLSLSFGPDGALLIGRTADRLAILDPGAAAAHDAGAGRPAPGAPWSSTGELAIVDTDGRIAVHRAGGVEDTVLDDRGPPVVAAAFSADAARLFTADAAGAIRIWDHAAARLIATIGDRGLGAISALRPTPDGRWLLVGHSSGAVRVHPVSLDAMRERACSVLRFFARAATGC